MIYEICYNEAKELCEKLEKEGYYVSIIPQGKWYNVLIYGRSRYQ